MFMILSSVCSVIFTFTLICMASNTFSRNSSALSLEFKSLRARILAGLLPIPRNPALPLSITSYSRFSEVASSLIFASVMASSRVLAENSLYSIFHFPLTSSTFHYTWLPSPLWTQGFPAYPNFYNSWWMPPLQPVSLPLSFFSSPHDQWPLHSSWQYH